MLYGLQFTARGERYQVRVQRVLEADFDAKGGASLGLFRRDRATGLYSKVASLKGGYGTTGPSVVLAIPLEELGGGSPWLSGIRPSPVWAVTRLV